MTIDRWRIPCTDALDRPRDLQVYVTDDGKIALQVPATEVAIIRVEQLHVLHDVTSAAAAMIIERRKGRST